MAFSCLFMNLHCNFLLHQYTCIGDRFKRITGMILKKESFGKHKQRSIAAENGPIA